MLKQFLNSGSYLALFAPDDEGKSAAAKERDTIKISDSTSNDAEKDDDNKETPEAGAEADKEAEASETEVSEEDAETSEDESEEDEDDEKRKLKRENDRLKKRINKITAESAHTKTQLEQALASLQTKADDPEAKFTKTDIEREAAKLAKEQVLQEQFNSACDSLNKAANKIDKDFDTKVRAMTDEVGKLIPSEMIGILADLENGGEILAHLANNPDEFEDLVDLPIARMTKRLVKLEDKLIESKKPKPKPISKVPDPPKPVNGNSKNPDQLTGNESMEEFVRIRARQAEARRKAKFGS